MNRKTLFLIQALTLLSWQLFSQKYSLEQCIEIAITNNLRVMQSNIDVKISEANLRQAKDNRLPLINGNTGQGLSLGRGIDPYTNTSVNQQIWYNSISVNTGVIIFNGRQQINTIKQQEHQLDADRSSVEANKENVILNIILTYLQVLSNQELLNLATNQAFITQQQIQKTARLIEAGILPSTHLIDLKAQLANDNLGIVDAKNNLSNSKLTLVQWMNIPPNDNIEVENISTTDMTIYAEPIESIFNRAQETQSSLRVYEHKILAANKTIDIIKGTKYPTISFNIGLSSNFSSTAVKQISSGEVIESNTGLYVPSNGEKLPVLIAQSKTSIENIGYLDQIGLNKNFTFGFQLKIPILNAYAYRNRLSIAMLNRENLIYTDKINRQQLRQNIEQAYNAMKAAFDRYASLSNQVEALQAAFLAAEIKLNSGTINTTDYNIVKSNLDRAKINFIQAKYNYLLRLRVLDFYQNK